jgi:HlyD family secretion protein
VTSVWILDSSGRAHQVPVTTGIADSLYTEIVEGALNEGDPVIVGIESSEEDQAEKKLPPGFAPSRR